MQIDKKNHLKAEKGKKVVLSPKIDINLAEYAVVDQDTTKDVQIPIKSESKKPVLLGTLHMTINSRQPKDGEEVPTSYTGVDDDDDADEALEEDDHQMAEENKESAGKGLFLESIFFYSIQF